ncbi:MAG TPA: ATP-binding protein, partial [Pseudonocardia sp.]|nr:ATP-binding protein [Pseudonocardia sp.]
MDAPRPPRAALAGYAAVLAVSTVVSAGWLGVGAVVAAVRYWPAAARLVQQDPDGTWARAVLAAAPASEPAGQALLDYALSGLSLGLAVVLVALGPRTWSIRLLVIALVGSAGAFNLQAHAAARTIEEATGLAVGQIHQVVLHGVACAAYILALLVFPTPSWNRVPGLGRTRRVLAVVGVATLAVVGVGTALLPHTSSCVLFFGFLVPVVGLAVLPHRVRHGHTAAVRIQARLLFSVLVASVALAVVLAAVTALLAGMGEQPALTLMDPTAPASAAGGEPIALLFWFSRLAAVAIAAAVLVATRRRDLWAAERVFSRGLAVALVAGLVGGGFVTLRALLAAALDPRPAAALAAAVAALGFLPLYVRAEWAVDRLLYGTRPTPYRALAEVAALSRGAPGDRLDLARVAEAVGRGLGATTCRMTVVRPGLRDRTYTWTEADGEVPEGTELVEVPIRHGEDHIGTIAVDRGAVAGLQDQRHHLLEDVAASLGVVVQASRAGIELERQLRAALAHAEEIAVSRRQAVAEMDNERRRIERDLHDGAQHHLVSLGLTLGLIEHQLERGQVAEARAWLAKLVTQMGTAEAVLAETTAGVSSAVLTGQGLAAALRADLEGAPVPATLETDGIGPDRRFPPEIEAAVYFCCAEAVGNARKHAPAATVSVRLAERDGILTFDVRDDGPGFAVPDVRVGTAASGTGGSPRRSRGIANIATRIAAVNGTVTLRSTPGGGTVVAGSVPVPTEAPPGDTGRTAPIPVPPRPAAPPPAVPPAAPRPPA